MAHLRPIYSFFRKENVTVIIKSNSAFTKCLVQLVMFGIAFRRAVFGNQGYHFVSFRLQMVPSSFGNGL